MRARIVRQPRVASRRGFTLVELLVALILLDCALLALAGTGAMLARTVNTAGARAQALSAASARIAALAATPCAATISGASSGAVREFWRDRPTPFGTRELLDSVEYGSSGSRRAVVFRTRAPC